MYHSYKAACMSCSFGWCTDQWFILYQWLEKSPSKFLDIVISISAYMGLCMCVSVSVCVCVCARVHACVHSVGVRRYAIFHACVFVFGWLKGYSEGWHASCTLEPTQDHTAVHVAECRHWEQHQMCFKSWSSLKATRLWMVRDCSLLQARNGCLCWC